MGEANRRRQAQAATAGRALATIPSGDAVIGPAGRDFTVSTPGGRMHVGWDDRGRATAMGQLVFFAEYLDFTGLFDRWIENCPLHYTSPNAPSTRNVVGSWMLSILDGHRRYAHLSGLRGDGVAPQMLGMTKIIGDDSLRRALAHIAPAPKQAHSTEQRATQQAQVARAEQWMQEHLWSSVQDALDRPWILDCDTTVKPLYGRQVGAEVGYNPHKPGRPSHVVHTYWMGNLRLVLHAELQGGKSHSATHSLPGLKSVLERCQPGQRPAIVRGDCAFGSDTVMKELENMEQPYLFKLKQSAGVKKLVQKQWQQRTWADLGQGWEGCEEHLKLMGWKQQRRVIVLRRAIRVEVLVERAARRGRKRKVPEQGCLQFIAPDTADKAWEYAVLVSNAPFEIEAIGQLYRDRADCENGFDELKNQWGWGGYTTHDIERCNLSAQAVALIYNWWSWYSRLANPKARMEAITSRPLLLNAVGRLTEHGGQKRVLLTVTHIATEQVKVLIANIRTGLQRVFEAAPQLPIKDRWRALVRYIIDQVIAAATSDMRCRTDRRMAFLSG